VRVEQRAVFAPIFIYPVKPLKEELAQ
jgi:hypothetical protein